MAKNDYRRTLIMLRGLEKGYSGHARLEKRVMTGRMDFVTGTPEAEETLSAAFVGNHGSKTRAQAIGLLKNDGRGQRALLASFDPRNIRGMDLSQITVAVISRLVPGGAEPVMYGYINGAKALDWQKIRAALDEIYVQPEEKAPAPMEIGCFSPSEAEEASAQGAGEGSFIPEEAPASEESVFNPDKANASEENAFNPDKASAASEGAIFSEKAIGSAENASLPEEAGASADSAAPAGKRLAVDLSKPWPEEIESLRILFLTLPAYEPFPKEDYVFVKAGMAEETNIDHCAVGVRAENGRIAGVCYAIPMPYSAQPPAGLEGYEWIGNTQNGWWVTCDSV